jgi:hypothetical protein
MPMSPRLLRPRASGLVLPTDAAARAYVLAVNAADGQPLEAPVVQAIDAFITGCKSDGIWSAIKASCILMGARTLSGALTPLAGSAPTNNNFVSGDYNRKTGLVGDGSTKYLSSGRANNADPQNSKHLSVYVTAASTASATGRTYIGAPVADGSSWLHGAATSNLLSVRANTATSVFNLANSEAVTGFVGVARNSDANNTGYRYSGATSSAAAASVAPTNATIEVYRGTSTTSHSNARMAWYSIGEQVNLALLDSRISTLYNAIGAAIP